MYTCITTTRHSFRSGRAVRRKRALKKTTFCRSRARSRFIRIGVAPGIPRALSELYRSRYTKCAVHIALSLIVLAPTTPGRGGSGRTLVRNSPPETAPHSSTDRPTHRPIRRTPERLRFERLGFLPSPRPITHHRVTDKRANKKKGKRNRFDIGVLTRAVFGYIFGEEFTRFIGEQKREVS